MAKSNKPIVWSLFAAGGTLAAFLAPVLAGLLLLAALGWTAALFDYRALRGFAGSLAGAAFLFVVISLLLWHAAHRLRITLHDFGARRDAAIAWGVYTVAGVGTLAAAFILARLA